DFRALTGACQQHRLLGFLAAVIRGRQIELTDDQHEQFETQYAGWLAHDLRLEQLLLRVLAVLAEASIRSRVFKGVALAHTVYDDPAARVFADVDLLVPSSDFLRTVAVLADAL